VEKRTKTKILVGGVAGFLLAVALGAVGGYAAAEAFSGDDEPEAVVARADVEPDDDPDDESDSLTEALEFLVDEAVEAGRLSEEEGERLKDRLDSGRLPLVLPDLERFAVPFGGRGFDLPDGGPRFTFGQLVDLDTAAAYLGVSETELRDELSDGNSLADVAREEDKSVEGLVDELTDDAERRIEQAVEDGRLSESAASRLEEDLEERIRERVERQGLGYPFEFHFELPKLGRSPGFFGPNG
jgi:polyhydroxyalkanoate synthesis regulator phasin